MAGDLTARLCSSQNRDGGWGYGRGSSWTEPTAMVLLALDARAPAEVRNRGVEFLMRQQRADGGWCPKPGVEASTWVTAFALLVQGLPHPVQDRALSWVLAQRDRNAWWSERLRSFLLGKPAGRAEGVGWSFYPGTAGWASPTAVTLLALRQCARQSPELIERTEQGVRFLMAHRCSDGGWNHGNTRSLGFDLPSYPETTGQALAALSGRHWPELARSLALAQRLHESATSVQQAAWLELGLRAHGRQPVRTMPRPKDTIDAAMLIILDRVRAGGTFSAV